MIRFLKFYSHFFSISNIFTEFKVTIQKGFLFYFLPCQKETKKMLQYLQFLKINEQNAYGKRKFTKGGTSGISCFDSFLKIPTEGTIVALELPSLCQDLCYICT